jgi:mannose-6-phosphate isomerase-like protein (cupin superfamily)
MRHAQLKDMVKGWFVGDFAPVVAHSRDVEVAVKHYKAGDHEDLHHHKIATEITLIVSGEVEMMGRRWGAGDIVVVEPGEATSFIAHTDAVNVVVKLPSAAGDKYQGNT